MSYILGNTPGLMEVVSSIETSLGLDCEGGSVLNVKATQMKPKHTGSIANVVTDGLTQIPFAELLDGSILMNLIVYNAQTQYIR